MLDKLMEMKLNNIIRKARTEDLSMFHSDIVEFKVPELLQPMLAERAGKLVVRSADVYTNYYTKEGLYLVRDLNDGKVYIELHKCMTLNLKTYNTKYRYVCERYTLLPRSRFKMKDFKERGNIKKIN